MKRFYLGALFCIGLCFSLFFTSYLSASCDSSNMTTEDFCIDVGGISPVSGGGGANVSGTGALLKFLESFSNLLLVLVPLLAGISGVVAGYYYIFSSGSSEKAGLAKNIIKYNIFALFIALGSYGIIALIASFLN